MKYNVDTFMRFKDDIITFRPTAMFPIGKVMGKLSNAQSLSISRGTNYSITSNMIFHKKRSTVDLLSLVTHLLYTFFQLHGFYNVPLQVFSLPFSSD